MRGDAYVEEVLGRCDALRKAGLWPSEQVVRPRAWLANFDEGDRPVAAALLERFEYFNARLSDRLFWAAYQAIGDATPNAPNAAAGSALIASLSAAVFTPVEGEKPNPTDSGHLLCRRARQLLGVPEDRILSPKDALAAACRGLPVIFLDDFVGSGDQFLSTWKRTYTGLQAASFADAQAARPFKAAYLSLISTSKGIRNIYKGAPSVRVCTGHVLGEEATLVQVMSASPHPIANIRDEVRRFLWKYSSRLTPAEHYMQNSLYKLLGYKERALMLAFEHSVPDATLPIFWSAGSGPWQPLVART